MARRLQGEEDDHAAQLREARRKNKELKAAQEANRLLQEKSREQERARLEAAEKERLERARQKEEAKKNKTGLFSSGTGTSVSTASGTKQKRVPFNFEAVGKADLSRTSNVTEALRSAGEAQDLAGSSYGLTACQWPSQRSTARQSREGVRRQQCSRSGSASKAQGLA